jgi:nucleotidyltransferase AbiEii toxin of type IV toxin-antitoxin system
VRILLTADLHFKENWYRWLIERLFKGGTSLSKAYGLIQRFSEDIDITVFSDDLDEPASVEELESLSKSVKPNSMRSEMHAAATSQVHFEIFLSEQLANATGAPGGR